MTEETELGHIGAQPPKFSNDEVLRILTEHVGVTGSLEILWGETDQNVKIITEDGTGFILKISNERENASSLDCQISAMQHLARHTPSVMVPHVRPLLSGKLYDIVTSSNGAKHLIHVMTLLDGVALETIDPDEGILFATGVQAGEAAVGLHGFYHPAARQNFYWDIRQLGFFEKYISGLKDAGLRKIAADFLPSFCSDVLPQLSALRSQFIHQDTNSGNVMVDPARPNVVSGLLDFGDMIHGPIVLDIAVAAAELAGGGSSVLDNIVAVVRGYDKACPLEETEIDLLYDMIIARQVLGILVGVTRVQNGVGSSIHKDYSDLYGPALGPLTSMGRDKVRRAIREACRFPEYCPPVQMPSGTNQAITGDLAARRRDVLGKALPLTYDTPIHTVRGEGVWLYDVDGRRYLDCYNNVPHVGHCHPHVVKTLARQAGALNTNSRYLFESIVQYAERLGDTLPGDLGACMFVNSGSEANDIALRMAKECTGQDGALIVDGAYHGITNEIYALSPSAEWGMHDGGSNAHVSELRADIETIENPDTVRGWFGADDPQAGEHYAADADRAIDKLKQAGHPVGAAIFDSAFSTHGILDVPTGYTEGVTKRVHAAGGMVIADEVQSGFGRLGEHMWGFQTQGFTPDFVTMGKPIGNGLALGVVVTTPAILERFTRTQEFFSTFGGNPVACAAAMAVMDVMENENLMENAHDTGAYLRDGLRSVAENKHQIGEVRGKGLFIGVDVVTDRDSMTPDAAEASRIKNHLRDNGCLVGSDGFGGNILKIRPPMVFQREHADIMIKAFGEAL
ncbi:MAG: aminotransferase class III-fold pyridoxal phosphate-dependent enzyme [Rhodospirillales bacterium]|nr:aminotransferase class III-fold pyridoxal phosphate-dependent enzyme [Rhodospirillales bacterium]